MESGTLTMIAPELARGVGAIVGHYSPIDHLASNLIVAKAGGAVWDEDGKQNLFPEKGARIRVLFFGVDVISNRQ